mgnify:CR=1 FL=1
MNQSTNWNDVFGDVEKKSARTSQKNPIELAVSRGKKAHEHLTDSIGHHLFDHIKRAHNMLHSQRISPSEKKQLRQSYNFFVTTAKNDLSLLEDTLRSFVTIKPILFRPSAEQIQHLNQLIRSLDKLILNYNTKMKKLHIPILLKNSTMMAKIIQEEIHQKLDHLITQGELKKASYMLLGMHYIYTPEQAASLINAGNELDTEHAEDFMNLVKQRLYSQMSSTPDRIDYDNLSKNYFLIDKSILPNAKDMLLLVHVVLEDLVKTQHGLCETKAKQQTAQLIEELNALIDSIAHSTTSIQERFVR